MNKPTGKLKFYKIKELCVVRQKTFLCIESSIKSSHLGFLLLFENVIQSISK